MNEETKGLPVVAWLYTNPGDMPQAYVVRLNCSQWLEHALIKRSVATEALAQRDAELAQLRGTIASLRQHKNEYMDAAEQTRKALQAELAAMRKDRDRRLSNNLKLRNILSFLSEFIDKVQAYADADGAMVFPYADLKTARSASLFNAASGCDPVRHAAQVLADRLPEPDYSLDPRHFYAAKELAALRAALKAAPLPAPSQVAAEIVRPAVSPSFPDDSRYTYCTTQATECAGCGVRKHTPLRVDWMGGYVCLTCIDNQLDELHSAEPAEVVQAADK